MTFICLNIELRTQPLIILVVIAGTDKERPGCSKIPGKQLALQELSAILSFTNYVSQIWSLGLL